MNSAVEEKEKNPINYLFRKCSLFPFVTKHIKKTELCGGIFEWRRREPCNHKSLWNEILFPKEKSPLRNLMYKPCSTIILTSLLSVGSAPLLLQSFFLQCLLLFFHRFSSVFISLISSIWSTREMRSSPFNSISLWSPKKTDVGCHLRLEERQLSPQAVGRDQQLGTGSDGLDLCTNKRGLSHTKCLLKTCERTTPIPKFTVGNAR